jgi:superfamily II DNA or RNA helicase
VLDRPTITGSAVDHYRRLTPGRRAVVFCISVQHSRHVAQQFQAAGFRSAWLDGGMDPGERARTVAAFREGRIQVLTSCDLISEGFDLPAIEVAISLRPTQSLALWIQQSGRALRPMPGKAEAVILDHAGNVHAHGLPDAPRDWALEGRERRRKGDAKQEVRVRICPACFGAQAPGSAVCVFCGAAWPADPRQVDEVAGELVELERKAAQVEARREQGRAQSLDQLVRLGTERGYKNPYGWARRLLAARAGR